MFTQLHPAASRPAGGLTRTALSSALALALCTTGLVGLPVQAVSAATAATSCAPVWGAGTIYNGGATASEDGINYAANWWTRGDDPATHSGAVGTGQPWSAMGACGDGTPTPPPPPPPPPPPIPPPAPPPTTPPAPPPAPPPSSSCLAWVEGAHYTAGQVVSYQNAPYTARVDQTDWAGTGWNPAATPALWTAGGTCSGGSTPPAPPPATPPAPPPTTPPAPPPATPPAPPPATPPGPPAASCAVKSAPTGKVLQGYWESWDNAAIHPGMGWIPITQVPAAYNVIAAAFPVILSDGTVEWQDGMDVGVKVPTPTEMCEAKAAGHWILLSIGGATASVNLASSAVVDRFIATIVPILKQNNFDGIDIDIESGLVAGASFTQLSTSQQNLIRLIDGVLAQMPPNFMLTMAPETAYVTGGQIAYGGPWGAYLPIIARYLENGRLSWLNMQYYNGSMYGCPATSFSAGTVQGFVEQTKCLNDGFSAGGADFEIPYDKQVPGLPAQPGAGGGYMAPSLVTQAYQQVPEVKGLMTWSINWDGSKGYTFANGIPFATH